MPGCDRYVARAFCSFAALSFLADSFAKAFPSALRSQAASSFS